MMGLWKRLFGKKERERLPFKAGDIVRLIHENPFKGTLSADNEYVVQGCYGVPHSCALYLRTDNRTIGNFNSCYFTLASNPIYKGTANRWSVTWQKRRYWQIDEGRRKGRDRRHFIAEMDSRVREYEEAIMAQDVGLDIAKMGS